LEVVERQYGHRPRELDGPEFPDLLEHVWTAFISLSNGRSVGFSGPNPISYMDIKSWCDLTGTPLEPIDVDIIKRLDRIFLEGTSDG
jgi:hypothetical protein